MSATLTVRLGVRDERWSATWMPDAEAGGGNLRVLLDHPEHGTIVVFEHYHQNEPLDDATLQRWASELGASRAGEWRSR